MLIVYASFTGNVKRFIEKLVKKGFECIDLIENPIIDRKFILITPTRRIGQIPDEVALFLVNNAKNMVAVASSGHKAWGNDLFARSGELIAERYNIPLLHKFQGQGFMSDVDIVTERVLDFVKVD